MTPTAVFDCMVFVQALANTKGPAHACYELVRHGGLVLLVSPEILSEVGDVLCRPKVRRKLPALTDEAVEVFLRDIAARAVMVLETPLVFPLERDPKDEPYINLALDRGAAYLVTWDQDLLDLMDDGELSGLFPELTILNPPGLLRRLSPNPIEPTPP